MEMNFLKKTYCRPKIPLSLTLQIRGRKYEWGVIDIENPDHCDYSMIRDMLVRSHMQVCVCVCVCVTAVSLSAL